MKPSTLVTQNHEKRVSEYNFFGNFCFYLKIKNKKRLTEQFFLDWEDDDLVAQCAIFFFAGFETTSTLLCFMAHELACNPDIQQKLYEEIVSAETELDGKSVTYETIKELKYMEMVISETLRLWPPVFQTDRQVTKPYRLEGNGNTVHLTTNDSVWIPIYGIHMVNKIIISIRSV